MNLDVILPTDADLKTLADVYSSVAYDPAQSQYVRSYMRHEFAKFNERFGTPIDDKTRFEEALKRFGRECMADSDE